MLSIRPRIVKPHPPLYMGRHTRQNAGMKYRITLALSVLTYTACMGAVCVIKHVRFGYDDFDLAHHTQSLYNILRGSGACSILGIPFMGNHFVPILYGIAPLYLLLPSPALLLILQAAALGLGAVPLYRIAHRALNAPWDLAIALAYLVYPPLILLNLFEFHPVMFVVPLVLCSVDALHAGRFVPFLGWIGLLLACQENLALIVAALGVYAALLGRRGRWIVAPIALGLAWFVLVVGLIMPPLNNNTIQFQRIYGHLGDSLPDVMLTLLRNPAAALAASWHPAKLRFLHNLLMPVGYLSVLNPTGFVALLPVLAQRFLSGRNSEMQLIYHYHAEFVPFVFVTAVFGLRRLLRAPRVVRFGAAAALGLMPIVGWVALDVPRALRSAVRPPHTLAVRPLHRTLDAIPEDDVVTATFQFLPALSGRAELHSMHHLTYGRYTLSDKLYPIPARLDWMVLNTMDRLTFQARPFYGPHSSLRLRRAWGHVAWDIVLLVDGAVVLRRTPHRAPAAFGLPGLLETALPPPTACTNIVQYRAADIRLVAYTLDPPRAHTADGHLLTLYWEKERDSGGDYEALTTLVDADGVLRQIELAPGSRLCPPQSWPAGARVADVHGIRMARAPHPGNADPVLHVDLFRLHPEGARR
jgi:uncharacterized membrane protein